MGRQIRKNDRAKSQSDSGGRMNFGCVSGILGYDNDSRDLAILLPKSQDPISQDNHF
jgi:hypothetical protein